MSKQSQTSRSFGLTNWAVDNQVTVMVLTVIILIAGLMSYVAMPAASFPDVDQPTIFVSTPYPGNSPVDIERLISRPLEQEINTLSGVDKISSTSLQGFSTIEVTFNFDVPVSEALSKVKDRVDAARSGPDFPNDLPLDPSIQELNISELMPIMNINLSGDFTSDQLLVYAEYLQENLENLSSISAADIRGIDAKEVRILMDQHRMEFLQISFRDVADAIEMENRSMSGGDLLVGGYRRNVRIIGEFESLEDIRSIIVKHEKGNIVYLRDIATVEFDAIERESYARQFQDPVVTLDIKKRSGENLILASASISELVAQAQADFFPPNLQIAITNDQSTRTKNQVAELENSIIFGVLLVVLVLTFFLGLRNALFVGIAIPLSMLLSFFILNTMGVTLNFMVLFALVLSLGMLVDNGIVIVENVYRFMSEGYSAIQAAKMGAAEVATPIIASTATTLAAFIPLALWPGMIGEFMKFLPMTLIIVLLSSLFVALVINPALASIYMKLEEKAMDKAKWLRIGLIASLVGLPLNLVGGVVLMGNLIFVTGLSILFYIFVLEPGTAYFQSKALPRLEKGYNTMIAYALAGKMAIKVFAGTVVLLFLSIILLGIMPPKVTFFPDAQPNLANIYLELPVGTDIEVTNSLTKQLEAEIVELMSVYTYDRDGKPYNYLVESIVAQVGKGTGDPQEGPSQNATPHKAKIIVAFREAKLRVDGDGQTFVSTLALQRIREQLSEVPGASIVVEKDQMGPPQGAAINMEVTGNSYPEVLAQAERLKAMIESSTVTGYDELKLDIVSGKPELPITVDREKARSLGISTSQIGDGLRTALFGKEISRFKTDDDDYPINLRFANNYRYNLEDLMNQRITFRDQSSGKIVQVPISTLATASKSSTFSAVKRKDLKRVITLYSGVREGANANEVVESIKTLLADVTYPEGISMSFTGQQEAQAKEMAFLSKALLGAVFMIFLIMVSLFNSARIPILIMVTVILSLIGVFSGLLIFRMEFVVIMTMIGIISLAGVVVNNAIVMADYAGQLLSRKKEELGIEPHEYLPVSALAEPLAQAGVTRLRPVLLTAITTILGLLPLATGMNFDFFTLFTENDPQLYFGGDNVAFWGPISWTVIFGLAFATFLTLVIVPVMLFLTERIRSKRYYRKITAA